jgi:ammonia channel protein AmtB
MAPRCKHGDLSSAHRHTPRKPWRRPPAPPAAAGASVVEPYAAFVIGALAAPAYLGASWAVRAARIDDPMDAAAVHLAPGVWGLVAAGLFARPVSAAAVWVGVQV